MNRFQWRQCRSDQETQTLILGIVTFTFLYLFMLTRLWLPIAGTCDNSRAQFGQFERAKLRACPTSINDHVLFQHFRDCLFHILANPHLVRISVDDIALQ